MIDVLASCMLYPGSLRIVSMAVVRIQLLSGSHKPYIAARGHVIFIEGVLT